MAASFRLQLIVCLVLFTACRAAHAADESSRADAKVPSLEAVLDELRRERDPEILVGRVLPLIAAMPPGERYELLNAWMAEPEDRPAAKDAVRKLTFFAPSELPPAIFFRPAEAAQPAAERPAADGVVSFAEMLMDAGRQSGKLQPLIAEIEKIVEKGIQKADPSLLYAMVAVGQGEAARPHLQRLVTELSATLPSQYVNSSPPKWSHYLLARACLADDDLSELGERLARVLIRPASRFQDFPLRTHLLCDISAGRVRRHGGIGIGAGCDPGLQLWFPATHQSARMNRLGMPRAWWVRRDGYIHHIAGPEREFLYFACPLSGTFEFSVDADGRTWAKAGVMYGGIAFEALCLADDVELWPVGMHDRITRPGRFQDNGRFNRLTVQVQPGRVRYTCNGYVLYEDKDASPTCPWFALLARLERSATWCNFQITGNPQIPREVRLTHADRMEGWTGRHFGESLPKRLSLAGSPSDPRRPPKPDPARYDWSAVDGVIYGSAAAESSARPRLQRPVQSWLAYHRPMQDGDSITYEFRWEPGKKMVHPAVGRIAMLVEPDGVRLHWITDERSGGSGLPADNAVEVASERRIAREGGPKELPLRAGAWNTMAVSLAGPLPGQYPLAGQYVVKLQLNGVEIYRRRLDPSSRRLFGLFHYKDLGTAEVRNVVLRGDWPTSLSAGQLANLAAGADDGESAENRRSRAALIGEEVFAITADLVLRRARELPPQQRYQRLLDWVLPDDVPGTIRLYGDFAPTDPPPSAQQKEPGGALRAPVLDLVEAAGQLDELGALRKRIEALTGRGDHGRRCRLALLVLIETVQENDDRAQRPSLPAAQRLLGQLRPLLDRLPPITPAWQRWPEMIAASAALKRPKLLPEAEALLWRMKEQVNQIHGDGQQIWDNVGWEARVRHALARARVAALAENRGRPFGADPVFKHFSPVFHGTANSHGLGNPVPHWMMVGNELRHYPGHHHDYLYLNVPLLGDFEVECELTSWGWRDMFLCYGTRNVYLNPNHREYGLWQNSHHLGDFPIDPPLKQIGQWYTYRISVVDSSIRVSVNGRQIYQEFFPHGCDPWLAIRSGQTFTAGVRNFNITGDPIVPEVLELSNSPDTRGWLHDYYDEHIDVLVGGSDQPDWHKNGEVLEGRKRTDAPGSLQQSLLRYHRPMLEDGQIDYEFYYEPGEAMTHPALGRIAFLLEPEGVKIHRLTDGKFDRTGLGHDNVLIERADQPAGGDLPLLPNQWNRMQLTIKGRQVSLHLNGRPIHQRNIEPNNSRFFGLFHYANRTRALVRNVRYRGDWPRQLPDSEELFQVQRR